VRAGYLTFALAALGLLLVGTLVGLPAPRPGSVTAVLGLDGRETPELERRRAFEVARRTASCMHSLGFAYDPVPEPPIAIPDAALDPIAWAARWGFGVTTSVRTLRDQEHVDVNAARAERLPWDERERYRRALHGKGDDPGCHGAATTAVYGMRERALATLRPHLAALERAIDADPAMDDVRAVWVECASAAIRPLASTTVTPDRERLPARILGWFAARLDAMRSARDLANAQALERWVAVAIARCESAFGSRRTNVAAPHEAAFIRIHGAALARIGLVIRAAEDRLASLPPLDPSPDR
jgi:hypothetical protein